MTVATSDLAGRLLDGAFRRAAALLTADAPLQDILDLGELALAANQRESALLLFGVAALERGLSPEAVRWQAEIAARTSLWRAPKLPEREDAGSSMIEQGLAELRKLLAAAPTMRLPDTADSERTDVRKMPAERFAALGHELGSEFRRMLEAGGDADLAALSVLMGEASRWELSGDQRRADGELATLAVVVTYDRLRRLSLGLEELLAFGWKDPMPRLLPLSPTGLGPFLSNVMCIVRDGRDLPALLRVARGEPLDKDEESAWLLALTILAPPYAAPEIARTVYSRGGAKALGRLTPRARNARSREWAWAVRDISLEIGNGATAAAAQRSLTRIAPGDWSEWVILGDLLSLMGDTAGAREAFTRCQAIRLDAQVTLRIKALDAGSFALATCSSGFFGDPTRASQAARLLASR